MQNLTSRLTDHARGASVPMLVIGGDGRVTQANDAAHRFLGYTPGSLPGVAIEQLAPDSERAALSLLKAAAERATHLRLRSRAQRLDGRVLDVCVTIEPCLPDTDQPDVFVSYKPLAPWEAQRWDAGELDADEIERLAG